jgi:hypothetical protein
MVISKLTQAHERGERRAFFIGALNLDRGRGN